jgi:hypothetical protein
VPDVQQSFYEAANVTTSVRILDGALAIVGILSFSLGILSKITCVPLNMSHMFILYSA